jgi:uncharacterized protein (TIGR02466 family)
VSLPIYLREPAAVPPIFAKTTRQAFFPTFAWIFDLPPATYEVLNRQLERDLDLLTRPRPPLAPGRNWQTEQNLHEMEEFASLLEVVESAVEEVLSIIDVEYDRFSITGCWANWNPAGAQHPPHVHPNNFLSGVYYVKAPEGGDSLSFHDPRPQVEVIAPPVRIPNVFNTTIHSIRISPGRLVIFPAWFVHSVLTNQSAEDRISISFNVSFPDPEGRMSRPKWAGIPVRGTPRGRSRASSRQPAHPLAGQRGAHPVQGIEAGDRLRGARGGHADEQRLDESESGRVHAEHVRAPSRHRQD